MFHKTRMYLHYFHLICDTLLYYTDLIKFILLFTFLSRSADTSGMLDTSLKREISGEFEEDQDLPIEVNLPCNEDLQVKPYHLVCPRYSTKRTSLSLFFLPTDAFEPYRAAASKGRPREVRLPSSQAGLGPDQVQGLLGRGLQEVLGAHTGGSGHLIWIEKQILAGADPAVPYSSRDDSRRASLVEPTVDQLLQVKGKSTNIDKDKK